MRAMRSIGLIGIAGFALVSTTLGCGDDAAAGGGGAGTTGSASASAGGTTKSGTGATGGMSTTATGATGVATSASTGGGPCPQGVTCVDTFVFSEMRDTSAEGTDLIDAYDCAAQTNEGGREIVYRVTIPSKGYLSAAVYDGDGVDVDVHVLTGFDPASPSGDGCLARGDLDAAADVDAGTAWVIVDTYVGASGEQAGTYRVDIGFTPVSEGPCAMDSGEMARVGDGGDALAMPATGPVVKEAHLVTAEEPAPFPATSTDELDAHYALSQQASGLVKHRTEVWAPLEGGSFYGAGIGDPADFPVLHEAFYVNMYWTAAARPAKGTRMILRSVDDPTRAVVVAAGYETGPGDLSRIGGTTEETHTYLGSDHDATLKLGIATDQTLDIGPRRCTD